VAGPIVLLKEAGREINSHRCPVASRKVNLKLSVIDLIISRLDSEYLKLLTDFFVLRRVCFFAQDHELSCKRGLEPLALKLRIKRIIGSTMLTFAEMAILIRSSSKG
jgi:hypothetical protein